jgi:hypothetical protein
LKTTSWARAVTAVSASRARAKRRVGFMWDVLRGCVGAAVVRA